MDEDKKFVVTDKRSYMKDSTGEQSKQSEASSDAKVSENAQVSDDKAAADSGAKLGGPDDVKVNFSGFILSLGASALMALGVEPDGSSNEAQTKVTETSLAQVREIISVISMIQEKTVGNLSDEEDKIVANILYTLRLKYMEFAGK